MGRSHAQLAQRFRQRQRTKGLRPVQLWLPDTRKAAFTAQVARDIATVAELPPDDAAMLDAFERIAAQDLLDCH